ncbi:unnamed protein product [Mytilus edulis]|uniref:B box-type domain-containing protein n=1 Tax=Mytilus edulis TaxID=6550 RepID=A0A8S3SYH6_MYTED|nr:unnamed protein product [Mytilus edulis]
MASSDRDCCTLCKDDGTSTEAVTWCIECEVFLCTDCEKHHKKLRMSKVHNTMSTKDYHDLPKFMQEISSQCSDHKKNRINTNNIQKTKAAEQVRSMRKSIDDFLNKLEKKILGDLESKQSKLKSQMNTLLQQLKTRDNQISQLQSEFSKMTQYATELQMYVGLREIEKTTSEAAKHLEDLKSGGQLDEVNLELTISSELQSILKDVKLFGDVNINTRPFTFQLKAGRKDQAQYLVQTIPTIEQTKPSFLRQLTIPQDMRSCTIKACRILPDGKYLILGTDYDKSRLLLYSNDGMFMRKSVQFTGESYDSCFIRNNTVAVALELQNQTALVDVEKNKVFKSINLPHLCFSVTSDGQILVISSMEKSTIVNLNDMSHKILEGVKANSVALFKGNIYGTIFWENKVCCYKSTGETLWTFKHDDIVYPQGITLDKQGFVYIHDIVSEYKKKVVVVSSDGKTCKTILSEADGIRDPWAIDINTETGIMIVSGGTGIESDDSKSLETAFVYKI